MGSSAMGSAGLQCGLDWSKRVCLGLQRLITMTYLSLDNGLINHGQNRTAVDSNAFKGPVSDLGP